MTDDAQYNLPDGLYISAHTFPFTAEIPIDPGRGWLLVLRSADA